MIAFNVEEAQALMEAGFHHAWMRDVEEGDMIAIPPVSRYSSLDEHREIQWVYVTRIRDVYPGSNIVRTIIGTTLEGHEVHHSYGDSYPVSILRLPSEVAV